MNNKIFTYYTHYDVHYIIIHLSYVLNNENQIRSWLEENTPTAYFTSVVIEFKAEEDAALFLLRWS